MHPDQLAALLAVADTGAFDRAAGQLGVSTSAVSQRIRALESALGRVLVRRGSPSTVTAEGATVLRYARQQQLLAGEMSAELGLDPSPGAEPGQGLAAGSAAPGERSVVELPVAVNLDSLATWFPALFAEAAQWSEVRLNLVADHEGRTAELLREGTVMAAVSARSEPVAGCRSEPLGALRYIPVASPALLERAGIPARPGGAGSSDRGWRPGGAGAPGYSEVSGVPEPSGAALVDGPQRAAGAAVAVTGEPGRVRAPGAPEPRGAASAGAEQDADSAQHPVSGTVTPEAVPAASGGEAAQAVMRLPVLRFDAVDDLEDLVLAAAGLPTGLPGPTVPGTEAYTQALLAGMGWGLLTQAQLEQHPGLVAVPGLEPVERRLTWYRWRLRSALLDRLTAAVHRAFAA